MKNDFKSTFIDTALFIYLLEEQPDFSDLTEHFLNFCYANKIRLVTSDELGKLGATKHEETDEEG